jgi:hypothetical protein
MVLNPPDALDDDDDDDAVVVVAADDDDDNDVAGGALAKLVVVVVACSKSTGDTVDGLRTSPTLCTTAKRPNTVNVATEPANSMPFRRTEDDDDDEPL